MDPLIMEALNARREQRLVRVPFLSILPSPNPSPPQPLSRYLPHSELQPLPAERSAMLGASVAFQLLFSILLSPSPLER